MKFKYVVILSRGTETPLLAPDESEVDHADLAKAGHVTSGGFAVLLAGEWSAASDPQAPQFKSRQAHDAELIRRHFEAPRRHASEWKELCERLEVLWQRQRALDEMGSAARVLEQQSIDAEIEAWRALAQKAEPAPARSHRRDWPPLI